MDDDGELLLRRYRSDVHALCAAFPEPASSHKIITEFKDNFDDDVPYRKFGYMSFEAFLEDHPDLQKVYIAGKYCYRAHITAATMEIQSLIAKQKKNKKKRGGKKGNSRGGGMQKVNLNRSFRNTPHNYFPQELRRSYRGTYIPPPARANYMMGRNNSSYLSARDVQPPILRIPVATLPKLTSNTHRPIVPQTSIILPTAENNPEEAAVIGVSRIMAALDKCAGKATLTKLNWAYQDLFNTQFDHKEMSRFFGTRNMRRIHKLYLEDKIELNTGYGGQWSFLSKENAQRQKEWDQQNKGSIVTEPKKYTWIYPNVKELYDKTIDILVSMHPETIPLEHIDEIYKRAYNVKVNTVELYSKTWEDLVRTTFSDGLRLTQDKRIALSPKSIKEKDLNQLHKSAPQRVSTVKRVTAIDLGLEYSDEDEDDSDYDEEDEQASCSSSSKQNYNSSFMYNFTRKEPGLKSSLQPGNNYFGPPPGLTPPRFSSPGIKSKPVLTETAPKEEIRRSIFDRTPKPEDELPASRILSQQTSRSIFNTNTAARGPVNTIRSAINSVFTPFTKHINRPVATSPNSTNNQVDQLRLDFENKLALNDSSMDAESQKAPKNENVKTRLISFSNLGRGNVSYSEDDMPTGFGGSSLISKKQHGTKNSLFVFPQTESFTSAPKTKESPLILSPGNYNIKLHGRSEQLRSIIKSKSDRND